MTAWLHALRGYAMPAGLGLINTVLVALWFLVLTPMLDTLDLDMRKARATNIILRNQVDTNNQALETIDENREIFNGLRKRGFVEPQERLGVTRLMERLRAVHGLTSIYYEVAPETLDDSRVTRATGFNIISTRVTVRMRGLFDADILEFSQAIIDEFPGQIRPLTFSLIKLSSPTEETLSLLRQGKLVDFVGGELKFEWNTLLPIEKKTSG